MPELPDITVYVEALERRVVGQPLVEARLNTPFLLRTVDPPLSELVGKTLRAVRRFGKRIVFEMEADLAAFDFPNGTLTLTEAGSKRRASLYLVRGAAGLAEFQRGGLEVLGATREEFAARLRAENHTVKRSLTDPRLFSGIGNAYSDEILHRARMSPVKLTSR